MKKIRSLLIAIVIVLTSIGNYSCVKNVNSKEKKIDELMNYCYQNDLFNGTVLIAENGKVVYKNAFGYANYEIKEVMKLNTPSCIGSVSKQFTAMAIMILKEQNKLSYEDKLAKYFPEIPGANGQGKTWERVSRTSPRPSL